MGSVRPYEGAEMKALLALFLIVATACDGADLKVKLSVVSTETLPDMDDGCPYILCVSVPDQPSIHEEVMYVHGSSQRIEFTGVVMGQGQGPFSGEPDPAHHLGNYRAILPHMAVITHCDTGRVIELDLDSHEYREFRQPRYPSEKQFRKEVERVKKDALRRVRWQTQDTGETKEFFGHVARRQITTIGGMSRSTAAERIDGWYLDIPPIVVIWRLATCPKNSFVSPVSCVCQRTLRSASFLTRSTSFRNCFSLGYLGCLNSRYSWLSRSSSMTRPVSQWVMTAMWGRIAR